MKRVFWPYLLMVLMAILCVLLLWNGYQSTNTLRAARAELSAAQSQLTQQRLESELELVQQAQALANEKLATLETLYGLPEGIFEEKPQEDFLLYCGYPIDPTLDRQTLDLFSEQTFTAQQAGDYTRFYHVWQEGQYQGIRVGEAAEGDNWVRGLYELGGPGGATIASPVYRELPRNDMTVFHGPVVPGLTFVPEGMRTHTYLEYCHLDLGGERGRVTLAAVQDQENYSSQLALYAQPWEDEDFRLIGIIATMEDGRWLGRDEDPRYLSVRDVTIFDLDGDGRCELIFEPPTVLKPELFVTGYDGETLTRTHDLDWELHE